MRPLPQTPARDNRILSSIHYFYLTQQSCCLSN